MVAQGLPFLLVDWLGRLNNPVGHVGAKQFADRPGMHAVQQVAAHEAVAAAAVDVETRAAGDQDSDAIAVGVEKALQQLTKAIWRLR